MLQGYDIKVSGARLFLLSEIGGNSHDMFHLETKLSESFGVIDLQKWNPTNKEVCFHNTAVEMGNKC